MPPASKKSRIILVGLFIFAGVFSLYQLTESPSVWYDEGFYIGTASNLAHSGLAGLRLSPDTIERISHLTVGYPLIFPLATVFKIFGTSVLVGRSLMVFFIIGLLWISYLFTKVSFGRESALYVLALLVTFPPLYGNGKAVLGEVPGLFFLMVSLFFLFKARNSFVSKLPRFALAGIFAGLCAVTKPIFILFLPAIAVGILIEGRRGTLKLKEIGTALLAGFLPILCWLTLQFQAGDTLKDIVGYYSNPSDVIDLTSTILTNIRLLFTDTGPLFLIGLMFVWLLSLWMRRKDRSLVSTEEIIGLSFSILIIIAFVRTAGWYRYLFEAQIVALVFFPNALSVVVNKVLPLFRNILSGKFTTRYSVALILVSLSVAGAYQVMFHSWVAEAYGSDKTAFWEGYFQSIPQTDVYFFYNSPEVAIFSLSDNYYQYLHPAGGDIGRNQLDVVAKGIPDAIVMGEREWTSSAVSMPLYSLDQKVYKYVILKKIR